MRRFWSVLVVLILTFTSSALEVFLADADGKPFAAEGRVTFRVERNVDDRGVETVRCQLTGLTDATQKLQVVAAEDVRGAATVWDGKDEIPVAKAKFVRPLLMNCYFLMGAAWDGARGVALASGAEDLTSYEDLVSAPKADGVRLFLAVHAALLGKGGRYSCTFHRFAFSPKYGIRDAFARYYALYPARFRRSAAVNPSIYGISAQYASWRWMSPETCRRCNASWEWCHGAGRSWGDPLNTEVPTGKNHTDYTWAENLTFLMRDHKMHKHRNEGMPLEEFDRIQSSRLANGYCCGVVNGFYLMALANLSNKIAARYPDSVATENPFASNDYSYSTEVFTFPECAWGQEVRRQFAALTKKHDIAALAFDVSRPRSVYRGVRLREMSNVGWDKFGPGVVRGVGSAKLFDYIRTLPNKKVSGNCGVIVNTKYQHLTDMLYMDTMMIENTPWDHAPPFPLAYRFALGEKGLTLWEKYDEKTFDPNFNKWPNDEQELFFHDLCRFAVHRSAATGASLPAWYLTEYMEAYSHAFVRMNDAGFKPVIGAQIVGDRWELARYGLGERSYLVLCNETNAVRMASLAVFPGEIETGVVNPQPSTHNSQLTTHNSQLTTPNSQLPTPNSQPPTPNPLYAPFFGGKARNVLGEGAQHVECKVGPLLVNVLEAVGSATGSGELSAEWQGDGVDVRLALESQSFTGKVMLREEFESFALEGARTRTLKPGDRIEIAYRDEALSKAVAPVKEFAFMDGGASAFSMKYAEDGGDSSDMGDRISEFFWSMTRPAGLKNAAQHKVSVPRTADASLPAHTVVLTDAAGRTIRLAAADREAFSRLVRRFLNVLNAFRYPDYRAATKLHPEERAFISRIPRW